MSLRPADSARVKDIASTLPQYFDSARHLSLQGKTTDAAHAQMGALTLMAALRLEAQLGELARKRTSLKTSDIRKAERRFSILLLKDLP